jgi:hypothetical protein
MRPAPAGLFAAAGEVQEKLTRAGFRFCFIGGVALQRWGEPRYTRDIDLTLLCPFGEELPVATRIAGLVSPRMAEADFGGGLSLVTCSAEDLVVMKAFAGRGQDWVDVEAIITRRGPELDWTSIDRELEPLLALKDPGDARSRLAALRKGRAP